MSRWLSKRRPTTERADANLTIEAPVQQEIYYLGSFGLPILQRSAHMTRIIFSWDYAPWPIFSSPDGDDPYPDVRPLISPELAADLGRWAEDMGEAYADETGRIRPTQSVADALDERFDDLTSRLIDEGVEVEQGTRWWRTEP